MRGTFELAGSVMSFGIMLMDITVDAGRIWSVVFKVIYITSFVLIVRYLILDNMKEKKQKIESDTAKRKKMIQLQWENDYAAYRKERDEHGKS